MARRFSMHRSGISQISAAITRIAQAIREERSVAMIATIYTGDSFSFQSRWIASFRIELSPCVRMIGCWRIYEGLKAYSLASRLNLK
jgi:hypothetical protein